jgi:hypothetical protein
MIKKRRFAKPVPLKASQNGAIITPTFVFPEEPIFQAPKRTFQPQRRRENHVYFTGLSPLVFTLRLRGAPTINFGDGATLR